MEGSKLTETGLPSMNTLNLFPSAWEVRKTKSGKQRLTYIWTQF